MIAPMCAYTCRHDGADVCMHIRAGRLRCFLHVHAGMFPYMNICEALMRAYSRGHDPAFECIIGMITPMCAYTCGQNRAHACMYMQANFRLWVH
jgi:hypothetical protein